MWRITYVDRTDGSIVAREEQAPTGLAALQSARTLVLRGHEVLAVIDPYGNTVLDSVRISALLGEPPPQA